MVFYTIAALWSFTPLLYPKPHVPIGPSVSVCSSPEMPYLGQTFAINDVFRLKYVEVK